MNEFLYGCSVALCLVAALFFFCFWRVGRDRLFVFFSCAFVLLAAQLTGLALFDDVVPATHYLFVPRLVAYALIILGIIDKNRRPAD